MSYKCQVCTALVPPNLGKKTVCFYQIDKNGHKQIAQELAVCPECKLDIDQGMPLEEILRHFAKVRQNGKPAPVPVPVVALPPRQPSSKATITIPVKKVVKVPHHK